MGVIWLQNTNGRIIHLPVVGPSINTADSPIPASEVSVSQISSGTTTPITVTLKVVLDFSVPGRTGSCVKCGACCTHPVEHCSDNNCGYVLDAQYNIHKCRYLNINAGEDKLGTSEQTTCSIYNDIMNISKGCLYGPACKEDIKEWMSKCGFEFKG